MNLYALFRSVVVFSVFIFQLTLVSAEQETADWWEVQRCVSDMVIKQGASIPKLATDFRSIKSNNSRDAMVRLHVFMMAGMNEEAIETLGELKALSPELENDQVCSIYSSISDCLEPWDLAKATVEIFAENISGLCKVEELLVHFLKTGWTVEKADKWLAGMPKGKDSFWIKERLRFNTMHDRGKLLIEELAMGVRENPEDVERAVAFLDALCYSFYVLQEKLELSWLAETVKPKLATDAEYIALRLVSLENLETAVKFYQLAINTPVTDEELFKIITQRVFSFDEKRGMFFVRTREAMASCLLKLGRNDEVQKIVLEAADMSKKYNLGQNTFLAGRVQAESRERVFENRIIEEEKKSGNAPEYWENRAMYYLGRNEPAKVEEALVKGLSLTTPKPEPERRGKGYTDHRSGLLSRYAHFLRKEKRIDHAIALIRREIEQSPANSVSSQTAVCLLTNFEFDIKINVNDEMLWKWLESRKKWNYIERRLLMRMIQSAENDQLDMHFVRAEKIVMDEDPSRAYTLGWIMNRMDYFKRAVSLLNYVVDNTDLKDLKDKAHFELFESYLGTGDWKNAEKIFPEAAKRLTLKELPGWYSNLSVAAGKAGAKKDAMRLWCRVVDLNPSRIGALGKIAKAGLRNELKDFYNEMHREMPSSIVPGKALMVLEKEY